MKELKKIYVILIILILVFIIIPKNLLVIPQEKNKDTLRPKFNNFNMIFLSLICFLGSFPFCIFCILIYRRPKDSDGNQ